ncbi:MAG: sugar phosphate isomerase/epimerase [Deltaproteobacteria bacterium]|nr:sugar phosphate isomerase/epimerase [Deltaproteobacteria bacterium]
MPRFGLATINHSPLHGLPLAWEQHLEAAAAAGFDALAPDVFWLRALEEQGVSLERLRQALDARGLACMEIAGLAIGEAAETLRELEETFRYAEALDAEFMNVRIVVDSEPVAMEQLCRCEDALEKVGTRIALEFSRGTRTRGIADVRALMASAGTRNAGVTLDTWHFFLARDGPDWDALDALPLSELANVQLSDGVPFGDRPYFEATMNERLLPGEGEFELARVAQRLHDKQFDGAVVVEVLSAKLREAPLETFAKQAAQTSRDWWARAEVS